MNLSNLSFKRINYQIQHIYWILKIAKEKLPYTPLKFYFHDLDKIFLLREKKVHSHKTHHHIQFLIKPENAKYITVNNIREMLCDWECARYFKSEKPLSAREYFEVIKAKYDLSPALCNLITMQLNNCKF